MSAGDARAAGRPVAGDPRGFAPLEPARHRVGERTELYDGTVTVDH